MRRMFATLAAAGLLTLGAAGAAQAAGGHEIDGDCRETWSCHLFW